jgi:hypothetical protein
VNVDITPDPEDIVQSDPEEYAIGGRPVEVAVCGPVEVRALPASGYPGYSTAQDIGTDVGVRLLAMEPRRQSATIIPLDQDIYIATSQAGAQAGAGGAMRIPAVIPYTISHMHEVWACAVSGTTDVSVETVNWSQ